jgi:hypothetical protein
MRGGNYNVSSASGGKSRHSLPNHAGKQGSNAKSDKMKTIKHAGTINLILSS